MSTKTHSLPLISVIVVCYNHDFFCKSTLNSIINQKYSNIELIIINDYSTDNSHKVIEEWLLEMKPKNCLFISNTENKGICFCLNKGLENAKGKYISVIAADDIIKKDKLKKQEKLLRETEDEIGFCYSNFSTINEKGALKKKQHYQNNYQNIFSEKSNSLKLFLRGHGTLLHIASCLIKAEVFSSFRYNESFLQEDFQFFVYAFSNYKALYQDDIFLEYRILNSSLSRNPRLRESLILQNVSFAKSLMKGKEDEDLSYFITKSYINLIDFKIDSNNTDIDKQLKIIHTYLRKYTSWSKLIARYKFCIQKLAKKQKSNYLKLIMSIGLKYHLSIKGLIMLISPSVRVK